MFKHTRTFIVLALLALVPFALSACRTTALPDKSLARYNYEAVDDLLKGAGAQITKETPLLVSTIGDVNNVETSSTLGRTISEQLSARLAQKGYTVAELKLRSGISIQNGGLSPATSGEYLLSRNVSEIAGEHKAAAALTGTYAVGAKNVMVSLRLIDIRSGTLITAYDYVLPKTADITSMLVSGTGNSASVIGGGFFIGASNFD